jgi:hypothetical protein
MRGLTSTLDQYVPPRWECPNDVVHPSDGEADGMDYTKVHIYGCITTV